MISQKQELKNHINSIMKPKPLLTGTEYADKYFYLPAEAASEPGKWTTRPYQAEILDCMTDLKTPIVVVKKPTRVGYSKLIGAAKCFFIDQQPCVILGYQPNNAEATGYVEDEFEPIIRDNPRIKKLIETPNIRGRVKKEKTVKKLFPNGYIEILGVESDRNLNRRTARVAMGDEVDTWTKEAGKAGDTVKAMLRRTSDFVYRKNIIGGKPIGAAYNPEDNEDLEDGISTIDYWYKLGDQRKRHLPCPHCDHMQLFEFEDLVWEKDKDHNGKTIKHYPETAHFKCKECDEKILNKHKRDMDKKGKWIASKPFDGIASFDFWAILSYSPNVTWPDIVKEFLDSKNSKLKLKNFYNEVLARTFEDDYEKVDTDQFKNKKEDYEAQVPAGVLILTFGADTQDNRIECEVVGWGKNEESWSIEYKVFHGDTSKPDVWKSFDDYLKKMWYHENGGMMKLYCGGLDTQGHREVIASTFCKKRKLRRIFAFKGANRLDAPISPKMASKSKKTKADLYMIGVNNAKNVVYEHLTTEKPGAGYMHFPNDAAYNDEYFKQLTAEKRGSDGRWSPTRARNEAIDCRTYAYSSLFVANIDLELLSYRGPMLIVEETKRKKVKRRIISKGVI